MDRCLARIARLGLLASCAPVSPLRERLVYPRDPGVAGRAGGSR